MTTVTAAKNAQLAAFNPYEAQEKLGDAACYVIEGLVSANLWPRPGQVTPPNGSDAALMCLNIQQAINDKDIRPEILLAIHNAVLVLSAVDFETVQCLPWLEREMERAR